jgi:hypothetical protein
MAVAMLMLVLSSCANSPGEPADGLPTYEGDVPTAFVNGTVVVDAESNCVYLEDDGRLLSAIWPAGFRLQGKSILDAEGQVVARDGEAIEGGGGYIPATARAAAGLPERCKTTGEVALISSVD